MYTRPGSILILIFLISFQLRSQTHLGIKGGFSFPNLTDDSENIYSEDFNSIVAGSVSLSFEIEVSEKFSFQPEIMFGGRGGKREGLQPLPPDRIPSLLSALLPAGTVPYADIENRTLLSYIEIPLLGRLNFGQDIQFSLIGGPYIGFLVDANQKISGTSPLFLDPGGTTPIMLPPTNQPLVVALDANVNTVDAIKSSNFGFHTGLVLTKKINGGDSVFFDGRVTYGLSTVQEDNRFGESKVGSVTLSLGYASTL